MTNSLSFRPRLMAGACLAVLASPSVLAQNAPDAGQLLREQTAPTLQAPRPASTLRLITTPAEPTLPGGAKVTLQSVTIKGNSVLSEPQLLANLGTVTGQSFDMAGLRGLAERIAETYHQAGYPFARAFLPQQQLANGQLVIEVIEGRYGQVKATGDAELASEALGFLSRLKTGEVIASETLERATLILDDQPGVKTAPVMRPGAAFGTGDLEVELQRTPTLRGDVGYDNFGNRYTGEHRLRANIFMDSPFLLGDQIQASLLYGSEDLWLGSLGYSLPLGSDGWRANMGYAQTSYELGKEFAANQTSGTAKVTTLGASYPLARSQAVNLTAGVTVQHKTLLDKQGAVGTQSDKRSDALPVSLQFDWRDGLGGGGLTYGSLTWTTGNLKLDPTLAADDSSSGVNSSGNFYKWNLDLARLQATPVSSLSLYGRVSGQRAGKNLDSSEKFSLGGAQGVRAFPTGEGFGDEGWLGQLELRYALGVFSPYAFYDVGAIRVHAKPESLSTPVSENKRTIAGAGLGTRYQSGAWSADMAVAWRTEGGQAQDANMRRNPRFWIAGSYRF